MLVRSVYERPESGSCVNRRIMPGPQRGTSHAAHTAVIAAPSAQHVRRFSVLSR
jgi:hypothetical protein